MSAITNRIMQYNSLVSENNPIRVNRNLHKHRSEPLYDMHFFLEMGIVLSGVMRRYYAGHSRLVRPGQLWFCGMWEPHGYEVIKAPCESIVLAIWPPLLAQLRFEEAGEIKWMTPFTIKAVSRPQIAPANKKNLLEQAAQLRNLTAPVTPEEKARIRIGLLNILLMVSNTGLNPKTENIKPRSEYWSRLNRAVQLVFANHSFVSTDRVAHECGLNRHVFSRLFKQWMGVKFSDFALRSRLHLAAGHLKNGSGMVKTIAREFGFVDTSHFNRLFWRHYNCSPSEYRRRQI